MRKSKSLILLMMVSIVALNGCHRPNPSWQSDTELDRLDRQLRANAKMNFYNHPLMERFIKLGQPAVTKLIPHLQDKDKQVRAHTVVVLAKWE